MSATLAPSARDDLARAVLDLASQRSGVWLIIGGRWADNGPSAKTPGGDWYDETWRARNGAHSRKLLQGVVVGGSEDSWRRWVGGATLAHLDEARRLLIALETAE
ncbi:MAG TPA: hypothetical protein VH393_03650 [Ktedonobacterales bacterium]